MHVQVALSWFGAVNNSFNDVFVNVSEETALSTVVIDESVNEELWILCKLVEKLDFTNNNLWIRRWECCCESFVENFIETNEIKLWITLPQIDNEFACEVDGFHACVE